MDKSAQRLFWSGDSGRSMEQAFDCPGVAQGAQSPLMQQYAFGISMCLNCILLDSRVLGSLGVFHACISEGGDLK